MKKVLLIVAIVILVIVAIWMSPAMKLKRDNPTFDFTSQEQKPVTKELKEDQKIVSTFIADGADQINIYLYKNSLYYYTADKEFIGGDGWPKVYDEYGVEVKCNFGSPMVPQNQKPPVNPVCANENIQNSINVYTKK